MNYFKDFFNGIKLSIKLCFNEIFIGFISMIVFITLPITILIGHFTGNIGLVYMEKNDAIDSLIFLFIIHFILSFLFGIITFIFLYFRIKKEDKTNNASNLE